MRNRNEQPRTITRPFIGGDGPSMPDAMEAGYGRIENRSGGSALRIGDEADAARIVLESGVIQAHTGHGGPANRSE